MQPHHSTRPRDDHQHLDAAPYAPPQFDRLDAYGAAPLFVVPNAGNDTEVLLRRSDFCIGLVTTKAQRDEINSLLFRLYASRGYRVSGFTNTEPSDNEIALQACKADRIVGTLTIRFDSADGLLAETLYRKEIEGHRMPSRRLSEVVRLGVAPCCNSREILAALFQTSYVIGRRIHRATDVFSEVNPHHASFYERMFGFRRTGEARLCPRVNAPAVLLHLDLARLDARIGQTMTDASMWIAPHSCFLLQRPGRAQRGRVDPMIRATPLSAEFTDDPPAPPDRLNMSL